MRYPVSRLPKAIGMVLEYELQVRRKGYRLPTVLTVKPATTYVHYMPGEIDKIAFVAEVSLVLKKAPVDPSITNAFQYAKDNQVASYMINWGSWGGDRVAYRGSVNVGKQELQLAKSNAVLKCYVEKKNMATYGEVLFHSSEMPPEIPHIDFSDRERSLMFVFAKLNGNERAVALARLGASQEEIENLLKKKAIKSTKGGHAVTMAAWAAQSEVPQLDKW